MERTEILISGFGGQGVVRLGQIFSIAAVAEGLFTTMLVSHGTETRGGYVRSQVVIDSSPIDSPVVEDPDYFCAMSKSAYSKFGSLVRKGTILYDPGYIVPDLSLLASQISISARDIAIEQLGQDIFANIVYLGVLGQYFKAYISREKLLEALTAKVPRAMGAKNVRAFELGYSLALSSMEDSF
ncbi:MAG TPA: 2-oxoacid:acceptor oxidoreductase family protein [Negativicutes bacterium]|nr:2-oxoacid:acceptor oxidoreductase family protein [Negativicutes bacterium]